jgi:hypothetical protein
MSLSVEMCRVEVDKPKPAVSMHAKLERIAQKKVCLFLTLSAKVLVGGSSHVVRESLVFQ